MAREHPPKARPSIHGKQRKLFVVPEARRASECPANRPQRLAAGTAAPYAGLVLLFKRPSARQRGVFATNAHKL
jgi:hypothetical protein